MLNTSNLTVNEINSRIGGINFEINKLPETSRELFGIERLEELIIQNRSCDVKKIQDKILSAVREYTQGEPQSDDLTLIVLRVAKRAREQKEVV